MPDAKDAVWLREYITTHPYSHPITAIDWLPFIFLTLASCALIAGTPPTTGWKLVRASLFIIYISYQVTFSLFTVDSVWITHWGNSTGMEWHFLKALELMLLYPPEENVFRTRPREFALVEGTKKKEIEWHDEPVPQHGTVKKLYWALDCWFSQRGLGWNFAAPLPESSKSRPFTIDSTRKEFLVSRLKYLAIMYLLSDLTRSYMTFGPGAAFFAGRPGIAPPYETLNITQRILFSLPVAIRVLWSIEEWYTPISMIFVIIGGILGWEGHWFGCSGWPPLFGSLKDLWIHPGLSHLWSKTWHQYFHHWLYLFGWHGVGETILRLPQSGISARPRRPTSDRTSKSASSHDPHPEAPNPIKFTPLVPFRHSSLKYFLINFIKSLIVFTLTGLYHDIPSYLLLLRTSDPRSPIHLSDCFPTTTFFILQPIALCVEALVKRFWRSWKDTSYPDNKGQPGWLRTSERTIGFIWTWWWLGRTSRYFVVGLTRSGMYLRKENQPVKLSLIGGAIYGSWYH